MTAMLTHDCAVIRSSMISDYEAGGLETPPDDDDVLAQLIFEAISSYIEADVEAILRWAVSPDYSDGLEGRISRWIDRRMGRSRSDHLPAWAPWPDGPPVHRRSCSCHPNGDRPVWTPVTTRPAAP